MEIRKCTKCKKALFLEEFKVNKGGKVTKNCKKCLEKAKAYIKKCKHGRQKHICKDCEVSTICEHIKIRSTCKDCRGAYNCQHNYQRSQCKDCRGPCRGGICQHDRQRSTCKTCWALCLMSLIFWSTLW